MPQLHGDTLGRREGVRYNRNMANRSHVAVLRSGAIAWNEWRLAHRRISPNLREAPLRRANLKRYDLSQVDLSGADLTAADLRAANLANSSIDATVLRDAKLRGAHMSGARIRGADFSHAILADVDLSGSVIENTNFQGATLQQVDFTAALLQDVNLRETRLQIARFDGAYLRNVDVAGAIMGATFLGDTTFHGVRGLDLVTHEFPSSIGIDTFFNSGGLPDAFLRGAGVPDEFIEYAASLVGRAIEYYSCFISYSAKDEEFARRLHADLQARNVRTWFAPEDLKIGDRLRSRINESIRLHDKLILVLSRAAIDSQWVETEVEGAFARERRENRDVLFPIRIDDTVFTTDCAWANNVVQTRHVGDFRAWKKHEKYAAALERLVKDLKRGEPVVMRS